MRYFGGKNRVAKYIAETLLRYKFYSYWEPFCGMCSVMERIPCEQRIASDIHPDLIMLWNALKAGWVPPSTLSEGEYRELMHAVPSPLRAFAGFGCSNSGRWFEGYARDKTGRNYALNAHNSLLAKLENLSDVEFFSCSYKDFDSSVLRTPVLIYCDPPYAQSTKKFAAGTFDTSAFWEWARLKSQFHTVVTSEYIAPADFVAVWEKQITTDLKKADRTKYLRTERLFVHESLLTVPGQPGILL